MIRITQRDWRAFISALERINMTAADEMLKYLETHAWYETNRAKQAALNYAHALATKYGEAGATMAAEFYDWIVIQSADTLYPAAQPAATATYGETASAVLGTMKTGNNDMIAGAVARLVKMAEVDTTMQNALRDGAQWAWIPSGDTCPYCIMLASRGWQNASKNAIKNGHAEHIHANCDCTYAVRFDSRTDVEGYDPKAYLRMYKDAPLDGAPATQENRLNAMRRRFYDENKERINAQKRAAYAKRQERESSAAEETDVS